MIYILTYISRTNGTPIIAVHKPGIAGYFIPRKIKYPTLPGNE
jgi:hypothetical protein